MPFDLAIRIANKARANKLLVRWGRVLATIFVVVGGLDIISSNAALAAGHIESNPLMQSLQADWGSWWSLPKMAVHLALAYLILWIPSKRTLTMGAFVSAVYAVIAVNNFHLAGWTL